METTIPAVEAPVHTSTLPLVLRLRPAIELSEDQFFELCQINRDIRIERNARGELLITPPAGGGTGRREAEITRQVANWAKRDGTGVVFSPSGGFRLPSGAVRAADAAWMTWSRLDEIPAEVQEKFIPACPDFVIELRSPSDALPDLHEKMEEYLQAGVRLGWLLDPGPRHVYVYRPNAPVERRDGLESISGDPDLPGFVLDLGEVW